MEQNRKTKPRTFQVITNQKNIEYILEHYINGQSLHILNGGKIQEIENASIKENYIMLTLPSDYPEGENNIIQVHSITQRYVDLTLKLVKEFGKRKGLYEVLRINIATTTRKATRINIINNSIRIQNIQIAPTMDKVYASTSSRIATEVILEKFQKVLHEQYKEVEIGFAERNAETFNQALHKHKKIIILKHTDKGIIFHKDPQCLTEDCEDKEAILSEGTRELHQRNALDLIIYPVFVVSQKQELVPYAYFKVYNTDTKLTVDTILTTLKIQAKKLILSIKRVLAQDFDINISLKNISHSGALLFCKETQFNTCIHHGSELFFDMYTHQRYNLEPLAITAIVVHHGENTNNMPIGILFNLEEGKEHKFLLDQLESYLKVARIAK